jgi:hypothetical protein
MLINVYSAIQANAYRRRRRIFGYAPVPVYDMSAIVRRQEERERETEEERKETETEEGELSFFEAIFSFVFGEGHPGPTEVFYVCAVERVVLNLASLYYHRRKFGNSLLQC